LRCAGVRTVSTLARLFAAPRTNAVANTASLIAMPFGRYRPALTAPVVLVAFVQYTPSTRARAGTRTKVYHWPVVPPVMLAASDVALRGADDAALLEDVDLRDGRRVWSETFVAVETSAMSFSCSAG
jgi:hypothetical protein